MTASQSTSRNGQKKPYYWCNQELCSERYKAIRRDIITTEFEAILKKIKPSEKVFNATKKVVRDVWERKEKGIVARKRQMTNDLMDIESERNLLLQRLTKAKDNNVVAIYESKLSELAEKEMVLKHSIKSFETHRPSIETALDIVFDFLKNPLDRWQKGDIYRKRLVLRLVFEENLVYNKNSGFETAILSLPLRVFCLPEAQNTCLVEVGILKSRP